MNSSVSPYYSLYRASSLAFWALFSCIVTLSPPALHAQAPTGTNLDAITDYSPQIPFRDIFLSSREWITQCQAGSDPGCSASNSFDTGESHLIDLDQNGWVKSLPSLSASPVFTSVATVWDVAPEFPAGRYVVLYRGAGTIEYALGAEKLNALSRVGRDVIQINPDRGALVLRITKTDPLSSGDYIRDIHVVAESDENIYTTNRFSEAFLRRLQPYSVLRFMDWARTNNSSLSNWNTRARKLDSRYSTNRGVPPEIAIELANVTGKTPWFNIPHAATDDFVEGLANLALNELDPNIPVYIEYSNEAWNSTFLQGAWIEQQGENSFLGGSDSSFTKRINFYGKRTAEICAIWNRIFIQNPQRVNCVIASQAANPWTASEALSCPLWAQGPCLNYGIRSLAISPYFGDYLGQEENYRAILRFGSTTSEIISAIFQELRAGGELHGGPKGGAMSQSFDWIEQNRNVAAGYNLSLIAYEGGQHLVGVGSGSDSEKLTELFTSANRDPRMSDTYLDYLKGWQARGGGLFVHFSDISLYTKFGSWGALEKSDQISSPKYDALVTYATGTPPGRGTNRKIKSVLSIKVTGRGLISSRPSGANCRATCSTRFNTGSTVMLTARAAKGFTFRGWGGACVGRRRECRVKLTKNAAVRANFIRHLSPS